MGVHVKFSRSKDGGGVGGGGGIKKTCNFPRK